MSCRLAHTEHTRAVPSLSHGLVHACHQTSASWRFPCKLAAFRWRGTVTEAVIGRVEMDMCWRNSFPCRVYAYGVCVDALFCRQRHHADYNDTCVGDGGDPYHSSDEYLYPLCRMHDVLERKCKRVGGVFMYVQIDRTT